MGKEKGSKRHKSDNLNHEITIYDIARVLKISPSTVSRGLQDNPRISSETKKRILEEADKMGYQQNKFASSLRKKHTDTIGVVVPKLDSFFMASVLAGVEKVTNQFGFGLIISQSQESFKKEASCISTLYRSRVDGILTSLALDTENLDHFNILIKKNIPVVFFDRVPELNGYVSVIINNYQAGYDATSHLVSQGCRNIFFFGTTLLRNVYLERFMGYKQALADNGIKYNQNLVFKGDLSEKSAIDASKKILSMNPRPDGIFGVNDTSCAIIIEELRRAGTKIPEEIAVVGFNNDLISHVITPDLTTIDYPAKELGEVAAGSLIENIKNSRAGSLSRIILKHTLVIRESSLKIK